MNDFIPVITKEYSRKVAISDILYIEQRQRRLTIVTVDGTYVCAGHLKNIEERLDKRFYHSLKSLVLNMDMVEVAINQSIFFCNGSSLMLSRESYIRTKQYYTAYLRELIE